MTDATLTQTQSAPSVIVLPGRCRFRVLWLFRAISPVLLRDDPMTNTFPLANPAPDLNLTSPADGEVPAGPPWGSFHSHSTVVAHQ